MQHELPIQFRNRFEAAVGASPFTSQRSLSIASGWSESRINRILTGQFDHSKDGPGFFGLIRVCEQIGVTPDYLAGLNKWHMSRPLDGDPTITTSPQRDPGAPNIEEMLRLYVRSGARIEAFKNVLDYCDIYEMPDDTARTVKIRQIGKKSLSALKMGEASHLMLQEAYDMAPPEFQEHIYEAHARAAKIGMAVEADVIDERMENHHVHVKIDYTRVALKLADTSGLNCILVYCQMLPQ